MMLRLMTQCFGACCLIAIWNPCAKADFPELFNTEKGDTQAWLSPELAAKQVQVPDSLRVSLFASEPEVQNPIDAAWDSKGRLWVAENYTYAERSQRFQMDLRDRVIIFDGTDQDQFTRRTVFTDQVQMLTSVEVGRGGVWLMCPPKLIFIPDADGDDVPDHEGEVVLDGFDVAAANYHNFANGLRFGPDGWLYGRCGGSCPGKIGRPGTPEKNRLSIEGGIWRYHPDTQAVEVLTTGTTNPWGHDWNDVGELFFVNTVNGHLWHAIPGAHFTRPFTLDPHPLTYQLIDFHADHWHFDTGSAWHQQRDGVANSYGGGHAHSGAMIYQGGAWPQKYDGRLFTLNFHGRRANQEHLHRSGSGYVAKHGEDFFLAADPWFRGMEITSGPDGNAFVLDWSDTGECHEHNGVHRTSGRIFKVSSRDTSKAPAKGSPAGNRSTNLQTWSDLQLAQTITASNAWHRRQASIEWATRYRRGKDLSAATEYLRSKLKSSQDASTAVNTLLMLHLAGQRVDVSQHSNEHVRAWGIRIAAEPLRLDDARGHHWKQGLIQTRNPQMIDGIVDQVLAAANDSSALVRLTCASTMQRLPVDDRVGVAKTLCQHGVDQNDHNLPLMIWYGLMSVAQESPERLVEVAATCRLPITLRLISRSIAEQVESRPGAINALLECLTDSSDASYQQTILDGIAEGLKGRQQVARPQHWDQVVAIDQASLQTKIRELSVVFGDGRALDELFQMVRGEIAGDDHMRSSALESLIQAKAAGLRDLCKGLLKNARLNVLAARGLSQFGDPEIGSILVSRYRNFRAPDRPQLMSILVSRKSFAMPMLAAIEAGKIPRADLSPYQVRQLNGFEDEELSGRVAEVWGYVRDNPKEISDRITKLKKSLTDDVFSQADRSHGRAIFRKACQTCHVLYGEGKTIGPDLTGANRSNLDYLLSNIVSPSSVVDKNYQMTLLLLEDGRIASGLVTRENERTLSLETATEKLTFDKQSIVSRKKTDKSPMPEGLLDAMSQTDIRDLLAYLRHPSQVPLKDE